MATLQGKFPEEMAHDIMEDITKTEVCEIDGGTSLNLDAVARYANRDKIQAKGERYWEQNRDRFRSDVLSKLVNDKHEAITAYMQKKEKDSAMEYFLLLRSKGVSPAEAEKMAGLNQVQ